MVKKALRKALRTVIALYIAKFGAAHKVAKATEKAKSDSSHSASEIAYLNQQLRTARNQAKKLAGANASLIEEQVQALRVQDFQSEQLFESAVDAEVAATNARIAALERAIATAKSKSDATITTLAQTRAAEEAATEQLAASALAEIEVLRQEAEL